MDGRSRAGSDAAAVNREDTPFWSVMIPTYRPDERLLAETLESVLAQDEGPGRMEIVVVDDASPGVDVAEMVRRLGGGRVRCEVQAVNRGLAGNWNRCVELARGEWVHLLHQDDLVRPGFYREMAELVGSCPEASAAFCRHEFIRPDGRVKSVSGVERETPGVLEDFVERLFVRQEIQCVAVVVSKATYARVGPYRTDLPFALDWDMWKRIAASGHFAYTPKVLAAYREHPGSETQRLRRATDVYEDELKSIDLARSYLPEPAATRLWRQARRVAHRHEAAARWKWLRSGEARTPGNVLRLCVRAAEYIAETAAGWLRRPAG